MQFRKFRGIEICSSHNTQTQSFHRTITWKIDNPKTLVADETATVVVSFGGYCTDTVEVKCSTSAVKELIVEYTGEREEGTIITKDSSGLKVTALCKNGDKKDNQLENLELRCPNCHYFTETYKTKNWSTQNNESAE